MIAKTQDGISLLPCAPSRMALSLVSRYLAILMIHPWTHRQHYLVTCSLIRSWLIFVRASPCVNIGAPYCLIYQTGVPENTKYLIPHISSLPTHESSALLVVSPSAKELNCLSCGLSYICTMSCCSWRGNLGDLVNPQHAVVLGMKARCCCSKFQSWCIWEIQITAPALYCTVCILYPLPCVLPPNMMDQGYCAFISRLYVRTDSPSVFQRVFLSERTLFALAQGHLCSLWGSYMR